jgi:hypothetical protein
MFELSTEEFGNLRSQFGTSSWGGTRYSPMAFTEQGVAMLSSVLSSATAIILLKLEQLEKKVTGHDENLQMIFEALKQLLNPP